MTWISCHSEDCQCLQKKAFYSICKNKYQNWCFSYLYLGSLHLHLAIYHLHFTVCFPERSSLTLPQSLSQEKSHTPAALLCSSVIIPLCHSWSHHYLTLCSPVIPCQFIIPHSCKTHQLFTLDWLTVADPACSKRTLSVDPWQKSQPSSFNYGFCLCPL